MTPPAPGEPPSRSRVVASYDVAGAAERGDLDDLVTFARELCEAPIGLVTALDADYQHFVARQGVDFECTPISASFCAHALGGTGVMEVRDAREDPRFAANPLVTGDTQVRFYAGAPMVTPDGAVLGTVCVLDTEPRPQGLDAVQRHGLQVLARAAMSRLDDRRLTAERAASADRSARALEESELRFRTLADTMPQMVWSTLPDGFHDYYNARWYEFTGVPDGSTDGEGWNNMFHPDDQERAWTRWRHSLETGEPYDIEYRLRHHSGEYRWVLGRALPVRDAAGRITRWFGTCTDIHEQKLLLDSRETVSQELSHRIKNIFAVISGLITLAARHRPDVADIAADLRQRITALGKAHDYVRPHSAQSRRDTPADSLHGLLDDLFAPYGRVRVLGGDVAIDDRSATPIALLFHELATNATKYGALSAPEGEVVLEITAEDDHVRLLWVEKGGPSVTPPSGETGFGTQLVELSAVRQLGGEIHRDWRPEGLQVEVLIPASAFSRR